MALPHLLSCGMRIGVMLAGLFRMSHGVSGVTVGDMRVVSGLLVVAVFMVTGGFPMVLGRVLVMFGGLVVVMSALVL
jgi:hypothetical protein